MVSRRPRENGLQRPGGSNLHYELLEKENDNYYSQLHRQVSGLKSLTLDIEAEVKSQNEFLGEMDTSFGGAAELLKSTMAKLGAMLESGGSRHMWYLVGFVVFIFLCLWFLS